MKLRVIKGGTPGKVFEIVDGMNLLGRACDTKDCNILDLTNEDLEAKVSRKHAMIEKSGETVIIWDLGSLNGTFVNRGDRLETGEQCHLKEGDQVIIGKTALVVEG